MVYHITTHLQLLEINTPPPPLETMAGNSAILKKKLKLFKILCVDAKTCRQKVPQESKNHYLFSIDRKFISSKTSKCFFANFNASFARFGRRFKSLNEFIYFNCCRLKRKENSRFQENAVGLYIKQFKLVKYLQ